jgi:hypothetical protein
VVEGGSRVVKNTTLCDTRHEKVVKVEAQIVSEIREEFHQSIAQHISIEK